MSDLTLKQQVLANIPIFCGGLSGALFAFNLPLWAGVAYLVAVIVQLRLLR